MHTVVPGFPQVPHFYALRFVNGIATFSTISFSIIAVGLSIYAGAMLALADMCACMHACCSSRIPTTLWHAPASHKHAIRHACTQTATACRVCAVSHAIPGSPMWRIRAETARQGRAARFLYCAGTHNLQATPPDYSISDDPNTLLWNIFNGLGIMAFAYGNTVLPGAFYYLSSMALPAGQCSCCLLCSTRGGRDCVHPEGCALLCRDWSHRKAAYSTYHEEGHLHGLRDYPRSLCPPMPHLRKLYRGLHCCCRACFWDQVCGLLQVLHPFSGVAGAYLLVSVTGACLPSSAHHHC